MTTGSFRSVRTLSAATVLATLIGAGCTGDAYDATARTSKPAIVRLENATSSTINVVVDVLNADGEAIDATQTVVEIPVVTITDAGVSYGVLTPIGASAAAQSGALGASAYDTTADVRIPGFQSSAGAVYCGSIIQITAQVDEDDTPIRLSGDGSGTPSFDRGSVGESGERYLIAGVDFECGEEIIVRVGQDLSGAGSATSGAVAVVAEGGTSPFDPIVNPGSDDDNETPDPTTITVQVENQGTVIGTMRLEVSTSSGGTQEFEVTVPPGATTQGDFACGTQLKLVATYPDPETPEDQDTERIVVLSGDGTGAIGFDDQSVSRNGERYLVVGSDVNCGDTVRVTIRDDVDPIGFQGIGVFSGTVTVTSAE